jgi:thiamine biosynthesis lipoprotein
VSPTTSTAVTLMAGQVRTRSEQVWGTVVSLDVRDEDATEAAVDAAWESVRAELHRVDRVFSPFRADSVVNRLRRGGTHVVAPDVAEVIDRCLQARLITEGAFDPWRAVDGFDPSGLVKGWAAQRCLDIARRHGLRHVSVDAGGDVVCGAGDWPIGVVHPDSGLEVVAVVEAAGLAVATSGTSERGEHVVDTRTGAAGSGARQATVVGPDAALADALATGLLVDGVAGARWFAALPGWSAYVVHGDRATAWGPAFAATTGATGA